MSLNVEEICEKLQSQDRRVKVSTLDDLKQKCLDAGVSTEAEILPIFDECYLYLLKCYNDRFESVRERAVDTVNIFMERLQPNDFHLTNIISTLMERMGQPETLEGSEEIRLVFMQQLLKLEKRFITTGNKVSLHASYEDIIRIIIKALGDSYPAVQREACACITLLAESADTYLFKPMVEQLVKALYPLLNHKHSQTRIAAVRALGYVALHIDTSGDALSRLLMEVSPLLMDSMPLVRRECGELGVRLLLELRDRYSFFERLIPLVLCCLKDDSPEVQEYILPLWKKCGKQYYEENEAELSKQEISDLLPANYPPNLTRPTIGCRGIVQRSLRLLKLIVQETSDWKHNVRLHSLKLLYQFVLHSEAAMTAKFFEIYPDVAKASIDAEPAVVQEAFKVSDLMGRLLNYEDWYEHGFEGLEKKSKEGYLKCFYYMYTASSEVKFEHNLRLSKLLSEPDFSQTLKYGLQLYVLKTIETILSKTNSDIKNQVKENEITELYRHCYCAVIKVMALSLESDNLNCEDLQGKGFNILEDLANCNNCSIDDLHEQFFMYALEFVDNIDAPLDDLSEPILLLYGFIKLVKFRYSCMKLLQQKINIVFEHCADESKIKIFSAVTVAMLDLNKTIKRNLDESCNILNEFLDAVVEKHLIWKAGANAEAMRSLAVATLCSVSQGAAEEAKFVLPKFSKYLPQLLEDQAVSTRHYAVKCLCNFGEIEVEHLKPIGYGCLQRLNDPSSNIRILAAAVIPKLQPKFSNKEIDRDIWLTLIKNSFDLLYLHYDTPEKRLQETIKDTVIELSKKYPKISKDSYHRTLAATHNCFNLKNLNTELPFIE